MVLREFDRAALNSGLVSVERPDAFLIVLSGVALGFSLGYYGTTGMGEKKYADYFFGLSVVMGSAIILAISRIYGPGTFNEMASILAGFLLGNRAAALKLPNTANN